MTQPGDKQSTEERLEAVHKLITKRIVTLFQRTDLLRLGEALRPNHDVAHRTTPSLFVTAWGSSGRAVSVTERSSSFFSLSALPVLISKAKRSVNFP